MMKLILVLLLGFFSITLHAQENKEVIFTIEGMKCGACVNTATNILKNIEGIQKASVVLETKQAVVSGNVDKEEIRTALAETGFVVLFQDETLPAPLTVEEMEMLDFEEVSDGKRLNIQNFISSVNPTVVYFHAGWCASCKTLTPALERMLLENPGVAYRKVDIINWKSNIAKQLTRDYKLQGIPFVLIFNENGELIESVVGNQPGIIEAAIKNLHK